MPRKPSCLVPAIINCPCYPPTSHQYSAVTSHQPHSHNSPSATHISPPVLFQISLRTHSIACFRSHHAHPCIGHGTILTMGSRVTMGQSTDNRNKQNPGEQRNIPEGDGERNIRISVRGLFSEQSKQPDIQGRYWKPNN